jgi:hypothetical protein
MDIQYNGGHILITIFLGPYLVMHGTLPSVHHAKTRDPPTHLILEFRPVKEPFSHSFYYFYSQKNSHSFQWFFFLTRDYSVLFLTRKWIRVSPHVFRMLAWQVRGYVCMFRRTTMMVTPALLPNDGLVYRRTCGPTIISCPKSL